MSKYTEGIGRRKTATARVRLYKGDKASTVDGHPISEYFYMNNDAEKIINRPLIVVGLDDKYYFTAQVSGGGVNGQIESVRLGLARALYEMDEELKTTLRKEELITRDPRAVERKKYHHVKARKKPQFSKR